VAPERDEIFNDDLLMTEEALAYATAQFPQIIHVLDHPQLRDMFAKYEKQANHARDVMRRLGFTTVVFALLALLSVATHPIWSNVSWTRWPALVIEVGGMLAALIAARAMLLGPYKNNWLQSRLMTERLRQWHFQLLVSRGPQIEDSCKGPTAVKDFQKERALWFNAFLIAHEHHLPSQLQTLVESPGYIGSRLHDPVATYPLKSTVLASVFDAYSRLRFDPQVRYSRWKLRTSIKEPFWQFLKWPNGCSFGYGGSLLRSRLGLLRDFGSRLRSRYSGTCRTVRPHHCHCSRVDWTCPSDNSGGACSRQRN
jgi:hypothetical protein